MRARFASNGLARFAVGVRGDLFGLAIGVRAAIGRLVSMLYTMRRKAAASAPARVD